ncbi:ATP-grasp domain-containing protein [Embleya sp. MST-111070]|uniref:ATP-grasp domain-containing protein n=1 Tax=Embleya sp. MST-111070 TaxID=3398231 RepID=UPI003F73AF0D
MTDRPSVVVVAAEHDFTADLVVDLLGARATVVRLDPARMREDLEVEGRFRAGRWYGALRHGDRVAPMDRTCAVYWRKPTQPETIDPGVDRWRAHENTTVLLGLLKANPLKVWCNDPIAVAAAALKPPQLASAHHRGLTVPDTLFTSVPDGARAFIRDHRDRVVVKALTQRDIPLVPTTRVRLDDDLHRVAGTVHYLQALIEDRVFDARVTVVDNAVFGARITTDDGALDWRATPRGRCHYAPLAVPAAIARACVAHVRDLRLAYAALDFVVTVAGWSYLETNPNGEFGFVQALADQPIAQAIADLLIHGRAGRNDTDIPFPHARMEP